MKFASLLRVAFLVLLTLSAARGNPPDDKAAAGGGAVPAEVPVPPVVLGPNDKIRVVVDGQPDLSVDVQLTTFGVGSFPLIGGFTVSGLTSVGVAVEIHDRLRKYLVNPMVGVAVLALAPRDIAVFGLVKKQGPIPIPAAGNLDLAAAMTACGGVTEKADPTRIELFRAATGKVETYDLASIKGGAAGRVKLEPGDRVRVKPLKVPVGPI